MKKFNKAAPLKADAKGLILYGRHAVVSALQNPQRKIEKLLCTPENAAEFSRKYPQITVRR